MLFVSACGGDSNSGPPVAPTPRPDAVTALSVTPSSNTLVAGDTTTLTPTPTTGGSAVSVSYSYTTSAPAVATVSGTGVLTAVAAGTATITVTATGSGNGFTTSTRQATAAVTVTAPPPALTALTVAPDTVVLLAGDSAALTPTATLADSTVNVAYAFATSAPTVATVSDAGVITAVSPGSATITVTATGSGSGFSTSEQQATALVTVTTPPPALTALSVSPDSVALLTGEGATLTATATTAGAGVAVTYTYMSSASTVATVNDAGVVTAVSPGTATITVTATGSGNGFTTTEQRDSAVVTVTAPPPALIGLMVSPNNVSLLAGGFATIATSATAAGAGVTVELTYASSATTVATVNETGVLSAVSPGTATITVTATGSGDGFATTALNQTIDVTVSANPAVLGLGFDDAQFGLMPAGSFLMGTDSGEFVEGPQRTVTLTRAFLMQKTEVTRGQWQQVMAGTGLESPFSTIAFPNCDSTCPVEGVSWNDIQLFLSRLNAQDPGKNYRLPTEAEWEYAARAGTTGDYGGTGVLDDMGWWSGNSAFPDLLHAVALKLPNAWGLYDMHGNVSEWVNDWYSGSYYRDGPNVDPPGPTTGTARLRRGGSWAREANAARSGYRQSIGSPTSRSNSVGFRLARSW